MLDGARHLRLQELQKLVLQVMETHLGDGLEDIDRLFAELESPDGYIHRSTLKKALEDEGHNLAARPIRRASSVASHDLDICFDKLDMDGTGVISLKVPLQDCNTTVIRRLRDGYTTVTPRSRAG